MDKEEIIKRLEEEISNLELTKKNCNILLESDIERLKKLRFDIKFDLGYKNG